MKITWNWNAVRDAILFVVRIANLLTAFSRKHEEPKADNAETDTADHYNDDDTSTSCY